MTGLLSLGLAPQLTFIERAPKIREFRPLVGNRSRSKDDCVSHSVVVSCGAVCLT